MQLFVQRHGPAADFAFDGGDSARPLTPAGRGRVKLVAEALRARSPGGVYVLASPRVRALSTAELTLATLGGELLETRRDLEPEGDFDVVLAEVAALGLGAEGRVLLVSHEPAVSAMVERLVGRPPRRGVSPASVVAFEGFGEGPGPRFGARLSFFLDGGTRELLEGDACVA